MAKVTGLEQVIDLTRQRDSDMASRRHMLWGVASLSVSKVSGLYDFRFFTPSFSTSDIASLFHWSQLNIVDELCS